MRFVDQGPDIPQELIEAQQNGQVLFFCGAGISIPAGLDGFYDLTKKIATKLHATDHDEVQSMLAEGAYDRVFTWLRREYISENVDYQILNALKLPKNPYLDNHSNLLTLSANPLGRPFVVTTNFDRLFEKARPKLPFYSAPHLPDLVTDPDISGVVYLHGRWERPSRTKPKKHYLVISSQDFGRAYLAHGWAARFMSEIVRSRTIVLIGYSGEDTLVRYLLEGLQAESSNTRKNVYAFDSGTASEVTRKWSSLGVRGLACPSYEVLWETISKWADAVRTPLQWEQHIHQLGQQSPQTLSAFERGQVASFVSTQRGAEKFRQFDPSPKAEWICTFDRGIRLADPQSVTLKSGQEIELDRLDLYGTDRDPSRQELDSYGNSDKTDLGEDFVGRLQSERAQPLPERMSNLNYSELWRTQSRVTALCGWFRKVIDQPAAIWWLLRQRKIHPLILSELRARVLAGNIGDSDKQRLFWRSFITFQEGFVVEHDKAWFEFRRRVKNGWSEVAIREFARLAKPSLKQKSYVERYLPPEEIDQIDELLPGFEVAFPHLEHADIDVPNEHLFAVTQILCASLREAVQLTELMRYPPSWFHNFEFPALIRDEEDGGFGRYVDSLGQTILSTATLLRRLAAYNSEQFTDVVDAWLSPDPYIFDRLRLFAGRLENGTTSTKLTEHLVSLSQQAFWDTFVERELMETMTSRWSDFSNQERWSIESRIWKFREMFEWETEEQFAEQKTYTVGRRLSLLNDVDTGLTEFGSGRLAEIKRSNEWDDEFSKHASPTSGSRGGYVATNTSTDGLSLDDSSELFAEIERREDDRTNFLEENKPFVGIVSKMPEKAVALLLEEFRKGDNQKRYWRQLFENYPKDASESARRTLADAILELTQSIVFECRYSLPRWIEEFLPEALKADQVKFWLVWDHVFDCLNERGEEATQSALGETRLAGRVVQRSRMTVTHGLNSPIGQLVDAIFKSARTWSLDEKKDDFSPLLQRLSSSLSATGEGAGNAAVMISMRYNYLFYHFAQWTKDNLVPMFEPDHPIAEASWRGFVAQSRAASHSAFKAIKPALLALLSHDIDWEDEDQFWSKIAELVVIYAYWSRKGSKYLSDAEVRTALRSFDASSRAQALWMLGRILNEQNAWLSFGRHFFEHHWPLERSYQTRQTTSRLLSLLVEIEDHFDLASEKILPLLTPLEGDSMFIHRMTTSASGDSSPISRHPHGTLTVLDRVFPDSTLNAPYNLREALDEIAEAAPETRLHSAWLRLDALWHSNFN